MTDTYIHVRCACTNSTHFVDFELDEWADGHKDINAVFVSDSNPSILARLRNSLRYVFLNERMVEADMTISKDKARELAAFLIEVSK